MDLKELNQKYKALTPEERIRQVYKDFNKILVTSSFGTTSALLLHQITSVNPEQVIHFIDTSYHFKQTLEYKAQLQSIMNLKIDVLKGESWKNKYTLDFKVWETDPDICCSINKVEPVDRVKKDYDIWVSGLMRWQNSYRKNLEIFEQKGDIIKFYPIIDLSPKQLNQYYKKNQLPHHPLQQLGYESVGCFHCTKQGKRREGRWVNFFKNECGLHI
ncbi:MAG: phosphoadenylyl-sulfate reductase [Candidatus Cyclobacteriaceae bacterium M3_2C_046]